MTMESSARQPKLLDRVRQAVRVRHDSRRTEEAYVRWIKTYPVVRARTPERLPVVLSRSEVASLFGQLSGPLRLIVTPLYGAGLRLDECLELRVKDLDFERDRITVRQGKGRKDRVTMLPASAKEPLRTDWDASCFRTRSSGSLRMRRRTGGGVAICVSGRARVPRFAIWGAVTVSRARIGRAEGSRAGGACSGCDQASRAAHIAALLCDAPARGGI